MASADTPLNHFPTTDRTWLMTQIDEGIDAESAGDSTSHKAAIRAISGRVMESYRAPLIAFVQRSRWRTLGDAADLVATFFARRLESLEYLKRWRSESVPLRKWLMNGMILELRLIARDARRQSARDSGSSSFKGGASESNESADKSAERAFDRVWARGLIQIAAQRASEELSAEGKEKSWQLFERHILDGVEYAKVAAELCVPLADARAMSRMAAYRLNRALRALLAQEGTPEAELDRAVEDVNDAAQGD